ncbi:hypothetical protein EDB89DRAFT_1904004 [Lactarius sanguifluus]|nr:hypothetical protein EDB89DRAFT_1904004 [Lactarius sanguifluus]
MTVTMMSLMAKSWCVEISNTLRFTRRATMTPRQPTQPASPPASPRRQHGGAQTLPCTTAPTQQHASPAMSPRHRRGLQSPPRRYDANTAACKPRRVTATPTRRNASPAVSPQHRHSGMQAPACRHDTDAACKPRHVATTLTRRHASPAVSPQRRRQQGKRRVSSSTLRFRTCSHFLALPALSRALARFLSAAFPRASPLSRAQLPSLPGLSPLHFSALLFI